MLNITVSTALLRGAVFELVATGSTDYLDSAYTNVFHVRPDTVVAISCVPALMYPGAINTVPITVSIAGPPDGNLTVYLAPMPGSFLA